MKSDHAIKALLFDMDGLMVDTERLYFETEIELAKSYGKTVTYEQLWKLMGRKPLESMTIFSHELSLNISPEKLLLERDSMMLERMKADLQPMPGLYKILDQFYGKLILAVVTGNKPEFLNFILEKLDIKKYFALFQDSQDIRNGKPHPEIYQKAIQKLGIQPEQCAALEDSRNGALSAKEAGCYTIAVPSEFTEGQDFSFADYIALNLTEANDHLINLISGSL